MVNYSLVKNPMPERAGMERVHDFEETATGYTEEMAVREALRCLNCRKKPCMIEGCPVSNHIPDFIKKITECDFEGAYQILMETTALPNVCGRVCAQSRQCEGSCVRGVKGQAVSIGALERFVADYHEAHKETLTAVAPTSQHKVAVIGSGPASIACAKDLADKGCKVTVFEKENVAGGIMVYGIPEFRLPKDIVKNEVSKMEAKGIEIVCGKAFGKDLSLDSLKVEGYEAVFVGSGAGVPMKMNIPGEEMEGVVSASDYLKEINLDHKTPKAKNIVIVGGGNVAMDACRCAARCVANDGDATVTVVYRRSEKEMPADAKEMEEAMAEGVKFCFLTNPVAVNAGKDGKAASVTCVSMELGEPDDRGRRSVTPIAGSEHTMDADLVISAIGTGFDAEVTESLKSAKAAPKLSAKGAIIVETLTSATTADGVYAGGDVVTGPKTVVHAMGAGKKAAAAIAAKLGL